MPTAQLEAWLTLQPPLPPEVADHGIVCAHGAVALSAKNMVKRLRLVRCLANLCVGPPPHLADRGR